MHVVVLIKIALVSTHNFFTVRLRSRERSLRHQPDATCTHKISFDGKIMKMYLLNSHSQNLDLLGTETGSIFSCTPEGNPGIEILILPRSG